MMRKNKWSVVVMISVGLAFLAGDAVFAQSATDSLQAMFDTPPPATRPWVYMWWSLPTLTEADGTRHLDALKAKGFGGFTVR